MSQMESDLCQHDNTLGKSESHKSPFWPNNNHQHHSSRDSGKRSSANSAKSTKNLLNVWYVVETTSLWLAERQLIKRKRICGKLIRTLGLLIALPKQQIQPIMPITPNNKYHLPQLLLPNQLKILLLVTRPMQLFLLRILKRRPYIGLLWHIFKKNALNVLNCLNG